VLRRLTRVKPLLRVSFALRGALVENSLAFALHELDARPSTHRYRLSGSSVAITIRHHTADILVLDELFAQREYEFPPPVATALARAGPEPRVIDLGANIGLFGAWALMHFPGARVVGVEADETNAAIHAETIRANPTARWELTRGFAAPATGTARLDDATEVTAVDVFPQLLDADLVKIDIEGAEWAILADPRFAQIRAAAIVLEYHRHLCPRDDPQRAAESALSVAGYEVLQTRATPELETGLIWGFRGDGR
jgi:hypothetical protein